MTPKIYGADSEAVFVKLEEEHGSVFVTLVNNKGKEVSDRLIQIISSVGDNIGVILHIPAQAIYTGDILTVGIRRDLE